MKSKKMKKLSSDALFYRSFIGLIVFPFVLFLFSRIFWINNFSNTTINVIYALVAVFVIFQWYKELKYKQVSYNNDHLLIKTYFTNTSIEVPFSCVLKIEKAFSLARRASRMSYKITFTRDGKLHTVYFFKSLSLYNIDDMGSYIGLKN